MPQGKSSLRDVNALDQQIALLDKDLATAKEQLQKMVAKDSKSFTTTLSRLRGEFGRQALAKLHSASPDESARAEEPAPPENAVDAMNPLDIQFRQSVRHPALLLLISGFWAIVGFTRGLEHDTDDPVVANSIGQRVVFFRALLCIDVAHLVVLLVVHRFAPPARMRLIFILLSHCFFILAYRLFYCYADGLWFERRFELLHGSSYLMVKVALGTTFQEVRWIVLSMLEPPLCLWSLNLDVEGRVGMLERQEAIQLCCAIILLTYTLFKLSPAADFDAVIARLAELEAEATANSHEQHRLRELIKGLDRVRHSDLWKAGSNRRTASCFTSDRKRAMPPIFEGLHEDGSPRSERGGDPTLHAGAQRARSDTDCAVTNSDMASNSGSFNSSRSRSSLDSAGALGAKLSKNAELDRPSPSVLQSASDGKKLV